MKFKWNKKYLYWGVTAFIVISLSTYFIYALYNGNQFKEDFDILLAITKPIINGLIIAYLLAPIVNFTERIMIIPIRQKLKLFDNRRSRYWIRACSIIITLLFVFFLIYIFILIVVPRVYESIESIIVLFPEYVNNIIDWSTKLVSGNDDLAAVLEELYTNYSSHITTWINDSLLPNFNSLLKTLSLSLLNLLLAAWNLILGLMISIYLLASKENFVAQSKKLIYAIVDTKKANQLVEDLRFVNRTVGGFISGKLLDSLLIGILCFICISFIGTPYAVLVSVIIGITNIIPFFGPYLGAIPCSILILMVDPLQCLYFVIFILILQQFDGNVLGPKILGESTGLSGFWVIFSITIFGGLFGVTGMVIGVPTFAVFYAFLKRYVNKKLRKRGLPIDTEIFKKNKIFYKDMPIESELSDEDLNHLDIDNKI
ncbi:MAG: AI-2E family transporter [Eubacteriales bacterium]